MENLVLTEKLCLSLALKYCLRFDFLTLSDTIHTLTIKQEARPLLEEIQ